MAQSKSDKKNALLKDLESIKQLLTASTGETEIAEPPLLEPMLETIKANLSSALAMGDEQLDAELPVLTIPFDDELDSIEPPLLNTPAATAKPSPTAAPLLETDADTPTTDITTNEPANAQPPDRDVDENKTIPLGDKTPAQVGLFDEPDEPEAEPYPQKDIAKPDVGADDNPFARENPFLPKHIRDRLQANRARQQEIAESKNRERLQAATAGNTPPGDEKRLQQIVDNIISRHLPVIERDLRSMLIAALRQLEDEEEK